MRYIGSKKTLLPFIEKCIRDVVGDNLSRSVFCDIFAGSGSVSRHFKPLTDKIISNDWEYYSYALNRHYAGNMDKEECPESIIALIDSSPVIDNGFIYANYCSGSGSGRMYFTDFNGMKIDAARTAIEQLIESDAISTDTYYFLLCSLLESADKVANTTSVYGSHLKHFTATASRDLILTPADFVTGHRPCEVYNCDANKLIKHIEGDILYLDPPYNARQFGANYHLLNTIAEYKPFIPKGKTGLREYVRSDFCRKATVHDKFESIIKDAKFKHIFLSYNNEGLMKQSDIRQIMEKYGRYDIVQTCYNRYKADKDDRRHYKQDSTIEYMHILEKDC